MNDELKNFKNKFNPTKNKIDLPKDEDYDKVVKMLDKANAKQKPFSLKGLYYSLEDKWYELVEKLHMEKIIDKIDGVIPSFYLVIGFILLIIGLLIYAMIPSPVSVEIKFVKSGNLITDHLDVNVILDDQVIKYSTDNGIINFNTKKGIVKINVLTPGYEVSKSFVANKEENVFYVSYKLKVAELKEEPNLDVKINIYYPNGVQLFSDPVAATLICNDKINVVTIKGSIDYTKPEDCVLRVKFKVDGYKAVDDICNDNVCNIDLEKLIEIKKHKLEVYVNTVDDVKINVALQSTANVIQTQETDKGFASFELKENNYTITANNLKTGQTKSENVFLDSDKTISLIFDPIVYDANFNVTTEDGNVCDYSLILYNDFNEFKFVGTTNEVLKVTFDDFDLNLLILPIGECEGKYKPLRKEMHLENHANYDFKLEKIDNLNDVNLILHVVDNFGMAYNGLLKLVGNNDLNYSVEIVNGYADLIVENGHYSVELSNSYLYSDDEFDVNAYELEKVINGLRKKEITIELKRAIAKVNFYGDKDGNLKTYLDGIIFKQYDSVPDSLDVNAGFYFAAKRITSELKYNTYKIFLNKGNYYFYFNNYNYNDLLNNPVKYIGIFEDLNNKPVDIIKDQSYYIKLDVFVKPEWDGFKINTNAIVENVLVNGAYDNNLVMVDDKNEVYRVVIKLKPKESNFYVSVLSVKGDNEYTLFKKDYFVGERFNCNTICVDVFDNSNYLGSENDIIVVNSKNKTLKHYIYTKHGNKIDIVTRNIKNYYKDNLTLQNDFIVKNININFYDAKKQATIYFSNGQEDVNVIYSPYKVFEVVNFKKYIYAGKDYNEYIVLKDHDMEIKNYYVTVYTNKTTELYHTEVKNGYLYMPKKYFNGNYNLIFKFSKDGYFDKYLYAEIINSDVYVESLDYNIDLKNNLRFRDYLDNLNINYKEKRYDNYIVYEIKAKAYNITNNDIVIDDVFFKYTSQYGSALKLMSYSELGLKGMKLVPGENNLTILFLLDLDKIRDLPEFRSQFAIGYLKYSNKTYSFHLNLNFNLPLEKCSFEVTDVKKEKIDNGFKVSLSYKTDCDSDKLLLAVQEFDLRNIINPSIIGVTPSKEDSSLPIYVPPSVDIGTFVDPNKQIPIDKIPVTNIPIKPFVPTTVGVNANYKLSNVNQINNAINIFTGIGGIINVSPEEIKSKINFDVEFEKSKVHVVNYDPALFYANLENEGTVTFYIKNITPPYPLQVQVSLIPLQKYLGAYRYSKSRYSNLMEFILGDEYCISFETNLELNNGFYTLNKNSGYVILKNICDKTFYVSNGGNINSILLPKQGFKLVYNKDELRSGAKIIRIKNQDNETIFYLPINIIKKPYYSFSPVFSSINYSISGSTKTINVVFVYDAQFDSLKPMPQGTGYLFFGNRYEPQAFNNACHNLNQFDDLTKYVLQRMCELSDEHSGIGNVMNYDYTLDNIEKNFDKIKKVCDLHCVKKVLNYLVAEDVPNRINLINYWMNKYENDQELYMKFIFYMFNGLFPFYDKVTINEEFSSFTAEKGIDVLYYKEKSKFIDNYYVSALCEDGGYLYDNVLTLASENPDCTSEICSPYYLLKYIITNMGNNSLNTEVYLTKGKYEPNYLLSLGVINLMSGIKTIIVEDDLGNVVEKINSGKYKLNASIHNNILDIRLKKISDINPYFEFYDLPYDGPMGTEVGFNKITKYNSSETYASEDVDNLYRRANIFEIRGVNLFGVNMLENIYDIQSVGISNKHDFSGFGVYCIKNNEVVDKKYCKKSEYKYVYYKYDCQGTDCYNSFKSIVDGIKDKKICVKKVGNFTYYYLNLPAFVK